MKTIDAVRNVRDLLGSTISSLPPELLVRMVDEEILEAETKYEYKRVLPQLVFGVTGGHLTIESEYSGPMGPVVASLDLHDVASETDVKDLAKKLNDLVRPYNEKVECLRLLVEADRQHNEFRRTEAKLQEFSREVIAAVRA